MLSSDNKLSEKSAKIFETIKKLYEQQLEMYTKNTKRVPDRIVSLHQPWLRPIARGKAGKKIEIGAKFDASVDENNFTRLEYSSFDAYNESTKLEEIIEAYHQRTGYYPKHILVDQIYSTRANRTYCKEHGIHLSAKALGRPKQDAKQLNEQKKQYFLDQCERIEVERAFSQLKRKCGIGLITRKLKETIMHTIALSIFVQNLKKIHCTLISGVQKICFYVSTLRNHFSQVHACHYIFFALVMIASNEPFIQYTLINKF